MIPPSTPSDAQTKPVPALSDPKTQAAGKSEQPKSFLPLNWRDYPVDTIRRAALSVAALAAAGTAVFLLRDDNPLIDASTAAVLGPAGSMLAPSPAAWWLWLPVLAGWLGYGLCQWLPRQRLDSRQKHFGWLILASQVLAFSWLLAVSSGNAGILLGVAAAQTAVGLAAVHNMNLHPPSSGVEGLLTDAPLGLSLAAGVLSLVAASAFILTRAETDLAGWGGTVWALVGLITVMVGITVVCMTDRGHLSVALATVWGLSCLAFERLTGAPESIVIGVGAAAAAFLVLVSAGSHRHQVEHERRRSERKNGRRSQSGSTRPANA